MAERPVVALAAQAGVVVQPDAQPDGLVQPQQDRRQFPRWAVAAAVVALLMITLLAWGSVVQQQQGADVTLIGDSDSLCVAPHQHDSSCTVGDVHLEASPAANEEPERKRNGLTKALLAAMPLLYTPLGAYIGAAQLLFREPLGERLVVFPLFASYQLELRLRKAPAAQAPGRTRRDVRQYFASEPVSAHMYLAGMIMVPRSTLLFARTFDRHVYSMLRSTDVDLTGAISKALRQAAAQLMGSASANPEEPTVRRGPAGGGLGAWIWPLALICPSFGVAYFALAFCATFPLVSFCVVAGSLVHAACHLMVLWRCVKCLKSRGFGAFLGSLIYAHGVPFVLNCHLIALFKTLSLFLPAVATQGLGCCIAVLGPPAMACLSLAFFWASEHANQQLLEGVRGHGGGMVDMFAPAPATAPKQQLKQHWPPPVEVPASLQEHSDAAPKHLLCPITHHIMSQPAVTSTGATYERSAIVEWLSTVKKDPLTGYAISVDDVHPNLALYACIEDWVKHATEDTAGAHVAPTEPVA